MFSKNHPIILFLDRNGFGIYQDTLTNISKFNFTPDIVSNLDVINKEQLTGLISTFIQVNKIVPSSIAIVLSDNVIYIKDLVSAVKKPVTSQSPKEDLNDDKEHGGELKNFLEEIPFEEILVKIIKTGNMNRAVVVNKDLIAIIIDAFTSRGFVAEDVVPAFMYGRASFTMGLTLDNVRVIFQNTEVLKSSNLLVDQEKIIVFQNPEDKLKSFSTDVSPDSSSNTKKKQNLRQYLLIGVFILLVIILVVVVILSGSSQTPVRKVKIKAGSASNSLNTSVASPSAIPALDKAKTSTTSSNIKDIKVKITQSAQVDKRLVSLKSELLELGYKNVVSEVNKTSVPEKSSIVFSQDIPANLRDILVTEIKKILPNTFVLESKDSGFTINIVLGKILE
jgi:hypothetical protein